MTEPSGVNRLEQLSPLNVIRPSPPLREISQKLGSFLLVYDWPSIRFSLTAPNKQAKTILIQILPKIKKKYSLK